MSLATQLKDIQDNRVNDIRRQASAFQAVFGQELRRTSDQRIVVAALSELCGHSKARTILDLQGRIDPSSAVFNEAARGVFLFIDTQLKIAASAESEVQSKPAKKR